MIRTQILHATLALAIVPATFASIWDFAVGPQYDTTHVYVAAGKKG
ncbi:hypothetical protein J2T07_001418 [Luteibacter jiangsuensis]|uniref:Uncharacterized protein n=1 Tax=Luteibacter jiangsuensis TaxID=637577 RepID=A0ABT9SW71_9GAMM|nr:hypothetical protein [Luteibacter jiangsuensis]MDQ0009241.1 hypothetical protein [Luteibacter jiangsuensis]